VKGITVVEGDITEQEVDAVVNAANSQLILGTGVAAAIRDKGGPTIQEECTAHGPIEVGEAAVTGAGDLPARFVIHAAGMAPGGSADGDSIRRSLGHALAAAAQLGCARVAVPAIGAGVGGFATQDCAETLVDEARRHLAGDPHVEEVRFVLLGEPMYRLFESALDAAKITEQMRRLRAAQARREIPES
jgi:O-acetyl-ADP-ribose deacetylase (regulator of RNase III)